MSASVGCMVAIVAILFRIQDQPLTSWVLFLSPSATLAILITAAKSTAAYAVAACISQYKWLHFKSAVRQLRDLDLFEEASRGPLGAVRLLVSGRPWRMVSVGALVTILALALDTFVQQVVKFDTRDVTVDDGRASFGLAHSYVAGTITNSVGSLSVEASTTDRSMHGAVYRGLFNISSPAIFNCSSRCTWNDSYVSLGFTSSCATVTAATLQGKNASLWGSLYGGGSNVTTPGGVDLSALYSPTSYQTVVSVGAKSLQVLHDGEGVVYNVTQFAADIARVAVLRVPSDLVNNVIDITRAEVVECVISLAAYKYSGISASGSELTIRNTDVIPLGPGRLARRFGQGLNYIVTYSQSGLPTLQAATADLAGLSFFFTQSFPGNIYDGEEPPISPAGMGDAFRTGNISQMFQNTTASMTDLLRSSYNVTGRGLSIDSVVYIRVQWEWMAFPGFVELAAVLFLLLAILQSRPGSQASHLPLWKSSIVAVLCHYVTLVSEQGGMLTGVIHTDVKSVDELERLAKTTRAKLE